VGLAWTVLDTPRPPRDARLGEIPALPPQRAHRTTHDIHIQFGRVKARGIACRDKTAELLSNLGEAMGSSLEEPIDLAEALRVEHGWYKPQSGYDGATAAVWSQNVHVWGKHLKGHQQQPEYVKAVQAVSLMLQQALHNAPDVEIFKAAADESHIGMLTQFPKLTPQIYEHALLVHVPALLSGSLLDGSPWFLEVFDKVWENHLLHHNNTGGCTKANVENPSGNARKSEAAIKRNTAWCRARKGPFHPEVCVVHNASRTQG
jgi:hypothetical protein